MSRFFLGQDNSAHWYIVPLDRGDEWDDWCDLDEDDKAAWDVPEWAVLINGHPAIVTFENPEVTI